MEKIRLNWLDALRGFAILLMILDHVLVYIFNIQYIEGLRYPTRLSMPLFMLIIGYLLPQRSKKRIAKRTMIILLFAVLCAFLDIFLDRSYNILFPISIALLFNLFVPYRYWFFSIFLVPFDLSKFVMDYGIFITMWIIFLGSLIRENKKYSLAFSIILSLLVAIFFDRFFHIINFPLFFLLPSLLIFELFKRTNFSSKFLEFFGRYPLEIYFAHLFIISVIKYSSIFFH